MKAQYLLRFDDICPSMNWRVWDEIESFLCREGVEPLLAVIPDNQDETLCVSEPDERFWDRVRDWEARGWTIGMHGWQHRYVTANPGILRINRYSEFAGLPRSEQERKLRSGLGILRRERVEPSVWIAPAHSFDYVTIEVLCQLGLRHISDGFSPLPYVDEFGMTWIPQQLWDFRWRPFGVWTICFHHNGWTAHDLLAFKQNVGRYRSAITSFRRIVGKYGHRRKLRLDTVAARAYRSAALAKVAVTELTNPLRRPATGQARIADPQ